MANLYTLPSDPGISPQPVDSQPSIESTGMASSPMADLSSSEENLLLLLDALKQFERRFKLENRFNLFKAIDMVRQEVRHSRFLAFLLDPLSSHGLGDRFLRAVLSAAVAQHPSPPVSRLAAAIADLSGSSVHCERDHFDITVEVPALRLLFVIENKVDASEGKGQLAKYRQRAEARYSNDRFMGCFLTPEGLGGEDDQWGTMSYSTIAAELAAVVEEALPGAEVRFAIQHYIQLIERTIVTPPELIEACRSIYAQHRAALDLIFEHGHESALGQAFDLFSAEASGATPLKLTAARSTTAFFLFESWLKIAGHPLADRRRWTSTFPVLLWFEVQSKKMNLRAEVGPFIDPTAKASFLAQFPSGWIETKSKAGGKGIFTRVKRTSTVLPEDPTSEDLYEAMKKLWSDSKAWNIEDVVRSVVATHVGARQVPNATSAAEQDPLPRRGSRLGT